MKKKCPFCGKRKLRKNNKKDCFEFYCKSCQGTYLPWKEERKLERLFKNREKNQQCFDCGHKMTRKEEELRFVNNKGEEIIERYIHFRCERAECCLDLEGNL